MEDREKKAAERAAYAEALAAMDDDALVATTEQQCWLSAFANNNPRAPAHWKSDLTYAEANRREKPWLYQSGWNRAYMSCGYEPSEAERARATEAGYKAAEAARNAA
jgi:hypothetical protein